ncbi:unnamed protein product, partial [marine sediment metagenome]
ARQLARRNLRLDGDTQSRASLDEDVIQEYADAYRRGEKLPPLLVFYDGTDRWIVDGFHRWWAGEKAEKTKLPCEVREGTREDARWAAIAVNQAHGMRRTNEDKAKAVQNALKHPKGAKMSDYRIAEYVGVHHSTVAEHRKRLSETDSQLESPTRTGRDGRTIETKNIGRKRAEPDEDDPPVCPNCKGTEFDDDGSCHNCHEPDVVEWEDAPEYTADDIQRSADALRRLIGGALGEWRSNGIATDAVD